MRLVWYSGTPKYFVIPGSAGRYRSVERGTNALRKARNMTSPALPRRFCRTEPSPEPVTSVITPSRLSSLREQSPPVWYLV